MRKIAYSPSARESAAAKRKFLGVIKRAIVNGSASVEIANGMITVKSLSSGDTLHTETNLARFEQRFLEWVEESKNPRTATKEAANRVDWSKKLSDITAQTVSVPKGENRKRS